MKLKTSLPLVLLTALFLSGPNSVHANPKTLDIYFIDVEGGAATLIVTPILAFRVIAMLVESRTPRLELQGSNRSITA